MLRSEYSKLTSYLNEDEHKTVLVILNIIVSFLISSCSSPKEQVRIGNGTFTIEEKDIQLICGEMHYPRIPHEYWRDRLKRARAMGLNTVSAYVFWNSRESLTLVDRLILRNLSVRHRKRDCM